MTGKPWRVTGEDEIFPVTRHGLRFTLLMRVDQFLRASRLVLRRTVAQELCEAGAVEINGSAARSSRAVREGDEIKIRRRGRQLTVRVAALPAVRQPSKTDAAALYEVLSDERIEEETIL